MSRGIFLFLSVIITLVFILYYCPLFGAILPSDICQYLNVCQTFCSYFPVGFMFHFEHMIVSCKTYHPGKKEDTPQRDGGPGPPPIRDTHPHKNLSDTSPFHSRRQEQPEDLPTGKPPPPITNNSGHLTPYRQ